MRNPMSLSIVLALAGAVFTLGACQGPQNKPDDHSIARTDTTEPIEGRATLGMPIELPGQGTVLVPFSVETRKGLFDDNDPYTRPGRSQAAYDTPNNRYAPPGYGLRHQEVRWHNAIFVDTRSGEQWRLLDRRGVVSAWTPFLRTDTDSQRVYTELLAFEVTTEDTNCDGLLDNRDARQVVVTKANGRDPRTISPADAQVWQTDYDLSTRTLFMLVVRDTNHDGWFDTNDPPMVYAWKLNQDGPATTLVDPDTLTGAVRLLNAD